MSVVFEFAVELTPKIGESMAGGLINTLANVLALATLVGIHFIAPADQDFITIALAFLYSSFILAAILLSCISKVN